MSRPRNCYRGKRRWAPFVTAVLLFIALLLVAAIFLFYYLQRFAVYDKDGVHLDFKGEYVAVADDESTGSHERVDAEIVVDESDFASLDLGAGEKAEPVRLMRVSGYHVTADNINYFSTMLSASNENGMVIQLKDSDGYFKYQSSLSIANGYGINGEGSIASTVQSLSGDEVWMAAEIATLTDNVMPERYPAIALKTSGGYNAQMAGQMFLDPYSQEVRDYIVSVMKEASAMGFREVVLTGFYLPESDDIAYNSSMTTTPDKITALASLARVLRGQAESLNLILSVKIEGDHLRNEILSMIGQDVASFAAIFDRIYFDTSSGQVQSDMEKLAAYNISNASARLVPLSSGVLSDYPSFCVN